LCFLAAGVAPAAGGVEAEAGVAVAPAAGAADFFECFFFAGVAEASGVGLGAVSAARMRGAAAKAAITTRVMRERMQVLLGNPVALGKISLPLHPPSFGNYKTAQGDQRRNRRNSDCQRLVRLQPLPPMQAAGDENRNLAEIHFDGARRSL
jgi:hypothetical protein